MSNCCVSSGPSATTKKPQQMLKYRKILKPCRPNPLFQKDEMTISCPLWLGKTGRIISKAIVERNSGCGLAKRIKYLKYFYTVSPHVGEISSLQTRKMR